MTPAMASWLPGDFRARVVHWLWTGYHGYREARHREAFAAAMESDEAFLASLRWLDEYGRLELMVSLDYRIQRGEDPEETDRLKRSRALLAPRL